MLEEATILAILVSSDGEEVVIVEDTDKNWRNKEQEEWLKTTNFIPRIIGLFPPIASYPLFCMGRSLGTRLPPTHTNTFLLSLAPPLSHLLLSRMSCKSLLFDYLMCTTKEAAVVPPESHQTLASVWDFVKSYSYSISMNQYMFVFQLFAQLIF